MVEAAHPAPTARRPTIRARRTRGILTVMILLGLQLLVFAPQAAAAGCDPPNPELPGSGMVGAIDPPAEDKGAPNTPYHQYGYAGMTWHTYDPQCGITSGINDPNATIDTWAGNQLFNIGKNIVGATNSLHYTLLGGDLLRPLDNGIAKATKALYEGPYVQWLWLPLLLLAIFLFRHIFSGDLAAMSRRGMWALAGLAVAAAAYATPLFYTHLLDDVLITGTSQIQGGFLPSLGVDERNALPTALHNEVIYKNWQRGEFGTPDAIAVTRDHLDTQLLDAQAWSKAEAGSTADQNAINAKQQKFKDVTSKLAASHSDGYFKGTDGSRTGDGFLAAFQGVAYGLFQLLAKVAILLGQVLMRVVVLASPLIGFIAVIYHDLLRRVAQAVAAVILNVVVLAVLAGLHTKLLTMIFDPANQLSLLTQVILAALITALFLVIGRPMKRMRQMLELSVGATGMSVPSPAGLFSRFRRHESAAATAQDAFWAQVRSGDVRDTPAERASDDRRGRPEMTSFSGTIHAMAQRLDVRAAQLDGAHGDGGLGRPALPSAYPPGGYPGPTASLPEAAPSRLVDAFPVVDRGWDRTDEPVVVPSEVGPAPAAAQSPRAEFAGLFDEPSPRPAPRRVETEVVGGRPVFVLYRPSRGFEVSDAELFDYDTPVR